MKRLLSILLIVLLSSCSLFDKAEKKSKLYVYINFNPSFVAPDVLSHYPPEFSSLENLGLLSQNPATSKITEFWLATYSGEKVNIDVNKIYTPYSPSSFDAVHPIEIPANDYFTYGMTTTNVVTKAEFKVTNHITSNIQTKATGPFTGTGYPDIYPSDQYEALQIPGTAVTVGSDGPVFRLDIGMDAYAPSTPVSSDGISTTYDREFEYNMTGSASQINPKTTTTNSSSGSSSTSCLEGAAWTRILTCDVTKTATVQFTSSTVGYFSDYDCTNQCTRKFDFTYKITKPNSEMEITYTKAVICGQTISPTPTGGKQAYSCNGNTLVFGNTYTR